MQVFKFGGASINSANAIRNMANIVRKHYGQPLVVVVSAMGKTTNLLERLVPSVFASEQERLTLLEQCRTYHTDIAAQLLPTGDATFQRLQQRIDELDQLTRQAPTSYNFDYDQIVAYGELISTSIIHEYLSKCEIPTRWLDARQYVIAEDETHYRAANPDWDETRLRINKLNDEHIRGIVCLTQGFIGGTADGKHSVTLGREGSDFTAAIFANCLDAEEVTIWKDVDGLLNADPKRFADTVQLPHIPYSEAIELAFYGATIIHPKTIKPLQNKGITLKVQSFLHPDHEPSLIDSGHRKNDESIPSYIVKDNQTLVSISPRDYSFMDERNLKTIFEVCADLNIHANMIQTSALMLSFCFDSNEQKLKQLRANLKDGFSVKYNDGLQLFTIRHYQEGLENDFIKGKKVLVKQGSRSTMQFVLSDPDHRP